MIKILVIFVTMALYASRGISYGIFTIKEKNAVGGISLFILTAAAAAIQIWVAA